MMSNKGFPFYVSFIGLLLCCSIGYGQVAEIKPPDTSTNENATAIRLFADAVKENLLGNSKEAEGLFTRFIETRPNEAAAYYELARIHVKENNPVKAIQNISKAISLDTSNKWYQELYANILANTQKNAEAAEIFSKMADKYSPSEEYLSKSIFLFLKTNNYERALIDLEKSIKRKGPQEDLLMQIHQIYLKQNNIDKAAKTLQRLIDANPKEGHYYALLAEMYLNNNNESKAKEILEKAEQKFPDDLSIGLGLASLYKQKKDTVQYTSYINKSISNPTIDAQTQITLLVSYLQDMGSDSAARLNATKLTEKLLTKKPENAVLLALYGDLLSTQDHPKEAAEAYKKSLKLDNNNLNVWQQLLFALSDKANADSLIFYSEEALSLFPSSALVYYLNGIGHINKNNFKQGIKSIETAIDYQPTENKALLAEMFASLGDAYNSLKDYTKADKNFDEALKLTPDNATVLNNYAYYLSVRKVRLEDAEKISAKSLEIRPGEASFLDTYGWIFYQQGKFEKAKELIELAILKNGQNADATLYEHLGDVYFKLKNESKALENWKIALSKDPKNEQIIKKIKTKQIDE